LGLKIGRKVRPDGGFRDKLGSSWSMGSHDGSLLGDRYNSVALSYLILQRNATTLGHLLDQTHDLKESFQIKQCWFLAYKLI
jgi:hypothetical protein